MKEFDYKSYGRIYTDTEDHVNRIKEIVKEIDDFEYDYMPDDLVAVYNKAFVPVYTGKFDSFDLEQLERRCLEEKIPCGCIVSHYNPYYSNDEEVYDIDPVTLGQAICHFQMTGFWDLKKVAEYYGLDYLLK